MQMEIKHYFYSEKKKNPNQKRNKTIFNSTVNEIFIIIMI